ncbi:zinc-ribbon domain-containing protein [Streptomyces sp. OfavH-34-F]|uniref:zinc-ribbon domain-containing protein n=1 Tax=Streptomyces sp. OfavH-34-F TaxID=2917760 RepID=UPI001EF32695|nr:zinc-ribbon domain-containing protein [Streptomyces sp. OfavH-34-F]MCG7528728.1 zinc-ribbon domain-containing protein [Streptomyces sp. OfavH-34-F]
MTRPCPSCGAANADDEDFCGSCGTYLGWASRSTGPAAPPRTDEPAPRPEPPRLQARIREQRRDPAR